MDENADNSVYNLITNLCEKFSSNQDVIKKLRSVCYSILLGKNQCSHTGSKDTEWPDAFCNLLAWQFTLSTKYGLPEHALELKQYAEYVQESYGNNVIQFLLCLRQIPSQNDEFTDFDLPESFRRLYRNSRLVSESEASSVPALHLLDDKDSSPDIWELASKEKFSNRKNWESFSLPEPDKEKPFISELGPSAHLWVENLPSTYSTSYAYNLKVIKLQAKSVAEFVKDIKYLLVGLMSYSFSYDRGNFILVPNLTVNGITPSTLKSFSKEFVFCGTCYKALKEMSMPDSRTGQYRQVGFIFAELCKSIQRYLEYYLHAIMSLPESIGLLRLDERTNKLRNHLKTVTAICKVGPYSESERMPHGVCLLNYLYQRVLNLTDKNILRVLYSILFPCCQVYFNRFLQQWLLEGAIDDPYDEFFIKPNCKYISTRGRTYWTRSYSLREEIVPDFLVDLKLDILKSGKTMNLLKLCAKSSKLCSYLMGKKPLIISCCLTSEQLTMLEQNVTNYYLEVLSECGAIINLEQIIRKGKEQDPIFMNLIAKKRAATLERLELERKKLLEEQREKKLDEITALREQYDSALQLKQERIAGEIERDIKLIEFNLSVENFRDKLIEQEAKSMIDYYNDLFEISEKRKKKIEEHIGKHKSNLVEVVASTVSLESKSSEDSFHSTGEFLQVSESEETISKSESKAEIQDSKVHSSKSLDIINANEEEPQELAEEIKARVLKEELDLTINPVIPIIRKNDNQNLTEAQRNKIRVLNSEFGIEFRPQLKITSKRPLTQAEVNRNHVLGTNECFLGDYNYKRFDNDNFVNKNINVVTSNNEIEGVKMKKSFSLPSDKDKIERLDYPVPMSVDSSPLSDSAASRMLVSVDNFESVPTTAGTHVTDEGFAFEEPQGSHSYDVPFSRNFSENQKKVFSKRVTKEEASGLSTNCLKLYLHESISIPLATQTKLVDNDILKYFVGDLKYFEHLAGLRNYFFLHDGEFGRSITENLYETLYRAQSPIELINFRTLENLVLGALEMSSKCEYANCLSFKINSLPKRFHLGDPDVLDCLSLTYKVAWPLNILLPADTIAKYDEVFKYLLKLNRISWVLKKIFLELKILAKISGKKEIYLMMSAHYRRVHQCRHVMMHFIQTLQNYIVGEVLQTSWEIFERNLTSVTNLDSLYFVHTTYIKNILFLCLLNQKSTPLRKVIQKIFVVILKFYDHLRSKSWKCENGTYVHPNFSKLESIFCNFEELVLYLFKVGRKYAKSGYQPHLTQLLDMLDINGYYCSKNNICAVAT